MKKQLATITLLTSLGTWSATAAAEVVYIQRVGAIQSPSAGYECTFFTLDGVAVADPSVAPHAWVALPKAHNGYKEALLVLHMAKTTGGNVRVGIGGSVCGGYAG